MHPSHARFVQEPDWQIDNGRITRIHPGTPSTQKLAAGRIYKYQEGKPVEVHDVPAGTRMNVFADPPIF